MTVKSIIVAVDQQNAIGKDNDLLCHLPNDLKHFKSVTDSHTIIMGRKTFESLPKGALPNRRNIVITRNKDLQFERCEMCSSIDDAFELCSDEGEVFIIGGGSLYESTIGVADKLYLTRIHNTFAAADTFFPTLDSSWQEVSKIDHKADEKHPYDYSFLVFEKIIR